MSFKYLYPPSDEKTSEAVYGVYSEDALRTSFIVRDTLHNVYEVYPTPEHFLVHLTNVPQNERCYEEVIRGRYPHRLKFDFDMPEATLKQYASIANIQYDNVGDLAMAVLNEVIGNIIEEINALYSPALLMNGISLDHLDITADDVLVASSCGVEHDANGNAYTKLSFHLVIAPHRLAVATNTDGHTITQRVLAMMPSEFRELRLLDAGVNKSTQNFRLTGCSKPNSNRVKTIIKYGHPFKWLDSVCSHVPPNVLVLPHLFGSEAMYANKRSIKTNTNMSLDVIDEVIRVALPYTKDDFTVRGVIGSSILLNRVAPSFCQVCKREHESDGARIDIGPVRTIEDDKNVCTLYYACWRQPPTKRVEIGQLIVNSTPDGVIHASDVSNYVEYVIDRVNNQQVDDTEQCWYDHMRSKPSMCNIYNDTSMRPFEMHPTLVVHANMKLGKTKSLANHLRRLCAEIQDPRILVISFRQTFTAAVAKGPLSEFGFKQYTEIKGPLVHPRMIVQVESLHRIQPSAMNFDMVVMDEAEATFGQFNSGLVRELNKVLAVFKWLMRYSKYVVLMDANITDRSYRMLEYFRPGECMYHRNVCANAVGETWQFTDSRPAWLIELHRALQLKEKIFIATNSLDEANTLNKLIGELDPDAKISLYSSKTSASEKRMHFANVDQHWSEKDVVIITPTCTAGVSFERRHFDKVFALFTDRSCDVETCRQMIGRVRCVKSNNVYVCFDCCKSAMGIAGGLPTSIDQLKAHICSAYRGLQTPMPVDGSINGSTLESLLEIEFDDNGIMSVADGPSLRLWLENERINNLSRNRFIERFVYQVATTGANIEFLPLDELIADMGARLFGMYQTCRSDTKLAEHTEIAEAPSLSDEEAAELQEKMSMYRDGLMPNADPPSKEEMVSLHKYHLAKMYRMDAKEKMTVKFVKKYDVSRMKRIYFNLRQVRGFRGEETCHALLSRLRAEEMGKAKMIYDYDVPEHPMAGRAFLRHRIGIGMVLCCGFDSPSSMEWIDEPLLVKNLRDNDHLIKKIANTITMEFKFQPAFPAMDHQEYLPLMLNVVNKITAGMYGLRIKKIKDARSLLPRYEIVRCQDFDVHGAPSTHVDAPTFTTNVTPKLKFKLQYLLSA